MTRDERTSGPGPGVAVADPMIGQILDGRYRLTMKLGEGGMGEVYAAEHVHIEKRVAIKLLRSEILTNQEAVTRFRQEARSASSIGHKNIIAIEDFGQLPDGRIFLAMELLHGTALSELIKVNLPPERLLNILIQTGHGLSAAHKKGIVHRDMKPENVFVTTTAEGEDVPKLLDFGIAKMSAGDGNNHLTKTGTIFGTPFYMAPEQALGQNVDHRADVYAMGVIMYEAFGGAVPFQGESFMAILTQHITSEPKPLAHVAAQHGRSLPPGIVEIIARAMRKEAEQRFQSMDEMVSALIAVYRGLAGAGMSSYLRAHASAGTLLATPVGPGFHAQPPGPGRSATPGLSPSSSPGAHPPGVPTPLPYASTPGSGPIREGGSGARYPVMPPDPQFASGMHGAGDSAYLPRPRSRAGLIVGLFILMAAVGGGITFLVLSQPNRIKDARPVKPDRRVANGRDHIAARHGKSEPTNSDPRTSDPRTSDPVMDPGATNSGAGPDLQALPDGQADSAAKNSSDTGSGGDEPAPAKSVVLVISRPEGAEIVAADGASLGRTPTNVFVEPGKPLEVTLRLRGRKDLRTTIDESQKRVTLKLERVVRTDSGRTQGRDDGYETGPSGPCEQDPGSFECRCLKNPDLPECRLE